MTDTTEAPAAAAAETLSELERMMGAEIRDPHAEWRRRRLQAPVLEGSPLVGAALEMAQAMGNDQPQFTAYSWGAVHEVLRNAEDFSSSGYDDSIGIVMGHMILAMDEPEHMAHRSLVAQAFRLKSMQDWETAFIAPLIDEIIDTFADRGHADLVEELTFVFPVQVIAAILGLPRDDWAHFQRLSMELIGIVGDTERGLNASAQLRDYFAEVLTERRANPQQDVISELAQAEVDGEKLSDEAIFSFLRLLLPAGAETTFRSSSNLLYLLLTHPEQYEMVRKDRSLIPQAIDEALRLEPPLTQIYRTATRDRDLFGTKITKGAMITPCMGAANRDESVRDRPDEFDITRGKMIEHVAFASGPHMCLGMHLARAETRVVLNAVMDRLPDLKLDLSADPHIRGVIFRSPNALPVTWRV